MLFGESNARNSLSQLWDVQECLSIYKVSYIYIKLVSL